MKPRDQHPYHGQVAAIATLHHKERAIGPALEKCLGLSLHVADGVDTDLFGTFTGEIARSGTMADAARAKVQRALDATGLMLAVASEGSFGPHPSIPFLAAGHELLLWRDAARDIEVSVTRLTPTNYWTGAFARGQTPDDEQLRAIGFPDHGLIVRPDVEQATDVRKGIQDAAALRVAIDRAASQSASGRALVQTDMRAHMNPTRMAQIRGVARKLAARLARLCPVCHTPGLGIVDVERGLPCEDCGLPTQLVRTEIHGCAACRHRENRRQRPPSARASAMWCDACNP